MIALSAVGAVGMMLYAAHEVGDHWIQRSSQAAHKGEPGWRGRAACAAHVATLSVTNIAALTALAMATGWTPGLLPAAAGLGLIAITHYLADRRIPLERLARAIGMGGFYHAGTGLASGAYAMDQSWHIAWIAIAALIIV